MTQGRGHGDPTAMFQGAAMWTMSKRSNGEGIDLHN